jgi:AsmA protein
MPRCGKAPVTAAEQLEKGMAQRAKVGRGLGWRALLGAVLALVIIAVALAASVDRQALAARIRSEVLPRISRSVGKPVAVGTARLSVWPGPRVQLGELSIGGAPGGPPLVKAGAASATVRVWPLLRSLGKVVELDAVELSGVDVNLVEDERGRWNYEGLFPGESGREYVVPRVTLSRGRVRLIELGRGGQAEAVALERIDATVENYGTGEPLRAQIRASFASDRQNLRASLERSAQGALRGSWDLRGASMERLRSILPEGLEQTASGGVVDLSGKLDPDGRILGEVKVDQLALRGQPASARARFEANLGGQTSLTVREFAVRGPGVDLSGSAAITTGPLRARAEVQGPLLDLDALLGALPATGSGAKAPPGQALVPEPMRRRLQAMTVEVGLRIGRLVRGALTASDLTGRVRLRGGVLELDRAQASLFGGSIDAAGTRIDLRQPKPAWSLRSRLEGLDLGEAMRQLTGAAPLTGRLGGTLELSGAGSVWAELSPTIAGRGNVALQKGALTSADLASELAGPVRRGLELAGKPALAEQVGRGQQAATELRDLSGAVEIRQGRIDLPQPLRFTSDYGTTSLDGSIGLDQGLALKGSALLEPSFVAALNGNQWTPDGPLEVPLGLGGSLRSPRVQPPAPQQLARSIASQAAGAQAQRKKQQVEDELRRRAGDALQGIFGRGGSGQ